jgi:hypothetical protein
MFKRDWLIVAAERSCESAEAWGQAEIFKSQQDPSAFCVVKTLYPDFSECVSGGHKLNMMNIFIIFK